MFTSDGLSKALEEGRADQTKESQGLSRPDERSHKGRWVNGHRGHMYSFWVFWLTSNRNLFKLFPAKRELYWKTGFPFIEWQGVGQPMGWLSPGTDTSLTAPLVFADQLFPRLGYSNCIKLPPERELPFSWGRIQIGLSSDKSTFTRKLTIIGTITISSH